MQWRKYSRKDAEMMRTREYRRGTRILMTLFFNLARWLKDLLGLIKACLLCQQTITLAALLLVVWGVGAVYAGLFLNIPDWGQWSFAHLFDLSEARKTLDEASGLGKVVSVVLYGVTWLIGGGILLGVLVDRSRDYLSRRRDGHIRYRFALRKHLVVLGWEDNVISLLLELSKGGKLIPFWSWRAWIRPRIVILSERPAEEVRRQIATAFGKVPFKCRPFSLIVYNGRYDSEEEAANLMLCHAQKIYLTGEDPEDSHDTRALMFLARFDQLLLEKKAEGMMDCHVRIASYSLFRLLILQINKERSGVDRHYKKLSVRFFNFYENWAKLIVGNGVDCNGLTYPSLILDPDKKTQGEIRLVVVGFGRMGQAVVVEALRSHKERNDRKITITTIDPDINTLTSQFMMSHADIATGGYKQYAEITQPSPMRVEDPAFKNLIYGYVKNGDQVTIVLTYNSPDAAIVRAVALASKWKEINVFARINISVANVQRCRELLAGCYKLERLYLYGFKSGAGFGKYSADIETNDK